MLSENRYAAVRVNKDTGKEWIDCSTISYDAFCCDTLYSKAADEIPAFAVNHPLVRIVKVSITEL